MTMTVDHNSTGHRIAYFISPHGYGHAARASAIMAAISKIDPAIRFEVFTQVPQWFFQDSLSEPFGYHSLLTDIGLAQKTPLIEDLPETLRRLDSFLPFNTPQVEDLAKLINLLRCRLVVCDIAPMGIAVAREAGIPSVLVENFTWDWIYAEYLLEVPELSRHIRYLEELFDAADHHIQTEPAHHRREADLTTLPVSRKARTPRHQTRQQLGIPSQAKVVMITMGGIPWRCDFLGQLSGQTGIYFIIPGADKEISAWNLPNLVLLPHRSGFFHPDLVNACDAVIAKAGYSTVAEVYYAGIPFGYILRPRFRESQTLADYIQRHMHGLAMAETEFYDGRWQSSVAELLTSPRIYQADTHGADQAAHFICDLLDHKDS